MKGTFDWAGILGKPSYIVFITIYIQYEHYLKYSVFLPLGVGIELIFALRAVVSKIQANFQNCHIWT